MTLNLITILASILFSIGITGVLIRRNAIVVLMCIELMLNAGILLVVGAGLTHNQLDAQMMVMFIMMVAAAEAAVGLAIITTIFKNRPDVDIDSLTSIKW